MPDEPFAIVTPSYGPDLPRCRLLCESVDRLARGATHYLLVDRRDLAAFSPMKAANRRIVAVEDLLPPWVFRVPMARRWWLSLRTRPLRNWVLQQLVKLSADRVVEEEAMVYVDSDVTFLRPFDLSRFQPAGDDRLRLNRVEFTSEQHAKWLAVAASVLGVGSADVPSVNYVASLVCWRRSTLRKLKEHLADRNGRDWFRVMAAQPTFSEYMVYGLFAEKILGLAQAGHAASDAPILHLSWGYDLFKPAEVDRFFADLPAGAIGMMVHSKDAVPLDGYAARVRAAWEA